MHYRVNLNCKYVFPNFRDKFYIKRNIKIPTKVVIYKFTNLSLIVYIFFEDLYFIVSVSCIVNVLWPMENRMLQQRRTYVLINATKNHNKWKKYLKNI